MGATTDWGLFQAELIGLIPHLRAFARSLCGNPERGEDLAQDTLAKAWAARESYEMGTNMKAWTFMILRNLFYTDCRRSWRATPLDPETAERTLVAVGGSTERLELDELRRAMLMLSPEHREAITLIGAAGLSYEEAAEITGVAIGTMKSRVSRARDQLALIYAEGSIAEDGAAPAGAMASIFEMIDAYRRAA